MVNLHELYKQLEETKQKITQQPVKGSGWVVLDEIPHLDLSIAQYTPVKRSSHVSLLSKPNTKKAAFNIKNSDMQQVFHVVHSCKYSPKKVGDELGFI